jgi:leucyl aminopeptidase
MTEIEFIYEATFQEAAWAMAIDENKNDPSLPSLALAALEKKKRQPAVEIFIPKNKETSRCIALRVPAASSKREREEAGAALFQKFCEGDEEILVFDIRNHEEQGLDIIAGFLLSGWRFDKYRTTKAERKRLLLKILCEDPKKTESAFFRTKATLEGVFYARSLTSEPPSCLFPAAYADRLKELEEHGVQLEILDRAALQKLGMQAILEVGKGSAYAPCVAILTWNGLSSLEHPIVIVGKGVTFDSGGLCLKSKAHQQDMKWDKAGAGAVAGLMKALALQKAPVHVIGIIGLAENMPDGNALRPGDIIRTSSGQTIEISDTDSEGRLVLADCLWYAQNRFKPKAMLDLGTLTVETIASLGNVYAGLYANSTELAMQLKQAGEVSGDLVWELPMGAPYARQLESSIADMKNEGEVLCGENGAAAELIRKFTNGIPWAHLDIAGVSWTKEGLPLAYKGVTGFGVRLLEEWLHAFF